MAEFSVQRLSAPFDTQWNSFVEQSNNGTIFHRLDFLSYHRTRFQKEEHPIVILKGTSLHGVLPCAVLEDEGKKVVRSPYGGSFGGPVFSQALTYDESRRVIEKIMNYWRSHNISRIILTLTPGFYQRCHSETFPFCLMEYGFRVANRDITHSLDLTEELDKVLTSRARNAVAKANKQGFEIIHQGSVEDLYLVLQKTYSKINKEPTHTIEEFRTLNRMFPDRIFGDILYLKNEPIAAIGYMLANSRVALAFYVATDPQYQEKQGQSLLIYKTLLHLKQEGFRYVDFGTSSVRMKANPNLFLFKESFGAMGRFRETYVWDQ